MTHKEKSVLVSLIFFLLTGILVRAVRSFYSKVELKVADSKEIAVQYNKFDAARLEAMRIHLNQAQEKDFEKLPGIGPKLAQAIVQYRAQNGNFSKAEELMKVKGFGKGRYERLRSFLVVNEKKVAALRRTK